MANPQSAIRNPQLASWLRWFTSWPKLTLVLMVLAALVPFITRPFNIDDPLFVWTAKQIQAHPTNPYGFQVNWYGSRSPMWEVTKNPPLACYYLALAGATLGWSEAALHTALLLPAIAVILGTWRLARHFCARPLFAASATLLTPVFLVSSATVMCDTLMLAFWVWATVLWVEGLDRHDFRRLAASGLLMALAALTKYFGAALIPLLLAYSLIARRRAGWWLACFLIPIAALAAYQWATYALYEKGLLSDAGNYVTANRKLLGASTVTDGLKALAFTGGCFAVATFLTPWLWLRKVLAVLGVGMIVLACDPFGDAARWFLQAQIVFWVIGGASILGMAVSDAWHRRDAHSWLLVLWVGGTFLFAGFFNWIVNARSILPMAPAVGILLARRLERQSTAGETFRSRDVLVGFAAGAVLALAVVRADFFFARAVRESAEQTWTNYGRDGQTLWFEGHWGFQYYLEKPGGKAVVHGESQFRDGDRLAVPLNNSNAGLPNHPRIHEWKGLSVKGPRWLTTSSGDVGAGFYASLWGPVPFAFGHVPPERVLVYVVGPIPDEGAVPAK